MALNIQVIPLEILRHIHSYIEGECTAEMEGAVKKGNYDIVKLLLRLGTPHGRSLRFAVILNHIKLTRLLIDSGAIPGEDIFGVLQAKIKTNSPYTAEFCRIFRIHTPFILERPIRLRVLRQDRQNSGQY